MNGSGRQVYLERRLGFDVSTIRKGPGHLLGELAVQDWFVIVYVVILLGAVWIAPDSAGRTMNLQRLFGLTALLCISILGVRSGLTGKGLFASLLYRAGMVGVVLISYFMLRDLLPVVNTGAFDAELYALDMRLFGFEPALWMDRFVTPRTTEWFAFFYYSYFFLISAYVLPLVLISRRTRLFAEFTIAFMGVYCIVHVLYMVVPGYGPYQYLANEFSQPLPMGFWYERVLEAVNGAGAQKDIFPSLHTAGPTTCFFFALRHRKLVPFKYVWAITGFFTVNIIIATMFLRWHYIIDIVAGIVLAAFMSFLAARVSGWEYESRQRRGLQPVWLPLWRKKTCLPEVTDSVDTPAAE